MSDEAPRASARAWNQAAINAVKRLKPNIDHICEMLAASGYPPLTEPTTVRTLQSLEPQQAEQQIAQSVQQSNGGPGAVEAFVKYVEDLQRKGAGSGNGQ